MFNGGRISSAIIKDLINSGIFQKKYEIKKRFLWLPEIIRWNKMSWLCYGHYIGYHYYTGPRKRVWRDIQIVDIKHFTLESLNELLESGDENINFVKGLLNIKEL